jgi:hypothetical protein
MLKRMSLEERAIRQDDYDEIENLMSRYQYLHWAGQYDEMADLFAKKTPGVKAEIADWGVYKGTEGIKKLYQGLFKYIDGDRTGHMFLHTLTTPLIQVAGDGKTAKGVWFSPGAETLHDGENLQAYWSWWKYGADFTREDGKWMLWHLHIYGIFRTPYEKGWIEPSVPYFKTLPAELKADGPTTHHWIYRPDVKTENVPVPPEPYETWNDSMSYIP